MSRKQQRLRELAARRRATCWGPYSPIGAFHDGTYECDHVSPYTKSAGNCDAEVLILLQDWCSAKYLRGPLNENLIRLGHDPQLPTNRNLIRLLDRHFGLTLADTYATNLFPFIKSGNMSGPILREDMVRAAKAFALPQIEIVQPRLVVCLGIETFRALQRALDCVPAASLADAIAHPFPLRSAAVWCQAHTGGLGRANRNRGGVDRVSEDWMTMSDALNRNARNTSQVSSHVL